MVTRRRFAIASTLAVAASILVSAPSCGSGFLDGLSGGHKDGGNEVDANIPDVKDDGRLCQPLHVPPPPVDVQDSELPGAIVVAVDAIRLDDATTVDASLPPTRGFDLDERCTCPEEESCTPPPDAGRKCDGDSGTDNALGRMFSYLGSIFADEFGPDFATRRIRKGAYGALFSIGGWNQQPNDPKVFVSTYVSQGFDGSIDGGNQDPKFDGTDVWTLDPASIQNGSDNIGVDCSKPSEQCFPVQVTRDAYVSNGVLVARINIPLAISTSSGKIVLEFNDVVLAAKLTKDGSMFRLEGEFVGRWPVNKVLASLARVPVNDKPLCDQTAFFDVARQEVCAAADVVGDRVDDNHGKTCDALSAAIRFSASTALLGRIYEPAQPPPPCTQFIAECPK